MAADGAASRPRDNAIFEAARSDIHRMKRRTLIGLGIAAGAVVATGATMLAWWQPGWEHGRLSARGRALFGAVAQAVLADLLPADPAARRAALQAQLGRLEASVAGMHPATRKEIEQLTTLLAHPAARRLLVGLDTDWPEADIAAVQRALGALRASDQALKQQVYAALRDLTNAAYFSDRSAWAAIGYPGPLPL